MVQFSQVAQEKHHQQTIVEIPPPPVDPSEIPYSIEKDNPITTIEPTSSKTPRIILKFLDAKSKVKRAERQFEDLLDEIFEANDSLAQDTSNKTNKSNSDNPIQWFALSNSSTEPCLANAVLVTLEDSIRKIKASKFFRETLEFDKILNLYKILERSILNADSVVDSSSRLLESETEEIERIVLICDNAMKAIKVLFRIFSSGRPEKNIIPEDLLNSIVNLLSKELENYILPLSSQSLGNKPIMRLKGLLGGFCQEVTQFIDILSKFSSSSSNLTESAITKLEFLTIKVIFYEASAKPKDSLFGATNIESLRVSCMRLTSILYGHYPDQRSFILDEILSSFAKLPVTKSARQFRLSDGVSIQLVSALIMKLVQTCGSMKFDFIDPREVDSDLSSKLPVRREELAKVSSESINESSNSAAEVINYLLSRAMKTTKSGDSPFRQLIDLFMEDFLNVLPNPEWPAAELLLYTLSTSLTSMLETDKDGVMATTMALELLGTIISKLWHFKKSEDKLIDLSPTMSVDAFRNFSDSVHYVLLYLQNIAAKDTTVSSSYRYFLTLYASILSSLLETTEEGELRTQIIKRLDDIIVNGKEGSWLDYGKDEVHSIDPKTHALKAYDIFLHSRSLSRYYDRILTSILRSLNHSKINMRTKSLRVVSQLLAQNADIFSLPPVQKSLSERLIDSSSQVRDAAVDIVGKYIVLKPEFAKDFYLIICDRSSDTGLAVRKRVVKLLKDIYNVTDDIQIKIEIADRLVKRVEDEETNISDLAISILTEFFFGPLDIKAKPGDLQYQLLRKSATQTITTILEAVWKKSDRTARLLGQFFDKLFHPVKGIAPDSAKDTVRILVEELTERASEEQDGEVLDKLLGLLAQLVKSNGSFIRQDQLSLLLGYIVDENSSSITPSACLYVLSIFSKSLDLIGPLRPQFLQELQMALLKRLSKFSIREQSEGVPCLWKVLVMRKDIKTIASVGLSCLKAIEPYVKAATAKTLTTADMKLIKLSSLLGNIGRYCEVDEYMSVFKAVQTNKPSSNLAELIVRKHLVFFNSNIPVTVRKVAIQTICNVCTTHPLMFLSKAVLMVNDNIMNGTENEELKITLMKMLIDFLNYEEETANAIAALKSVKKSQEVDLGVFYGVTNKFVNDGASASLMQRYIPKVIEIALSGETDIALTATLLLERIISQGFANPRIAVSTIVALETSRRADISTVAKSMHAKLHDKHESLIESSYVEGVKAAANYRLKLGTNMFDEYDNFSYFYHFMKSSRQSKRKFLLGVTKTLDFRVLDSMKSLASHFWYVVFVANSLSTLHFYSVEEVYTVIHGLDKVLSGTGVSVSNLIEERLEGKTEGVESWEKLARCAVVLHAVWAVRQFIKAAYNVSELKAREFVPSKPGKDPKPATRLAAYANERLNLIRQPNSEEATTMVDMVSPFDNEELNIIRCKTVFEQLSPEEFQDDNILAHNNGNDKGNGESNNINSNNNNGYGVDIVDIARKRSTYSPDPQDDLHKRARYD